MTSLIRTVLKAGTVWDSRPRTVMKPFLKLTGRVVDASNAPVITLDTIPEGTRIRFRNYNGKRMFWHEEANVERVRWQIYKEENEDTRL